MLTQYLLDNRQPEILNNIHSITDRLIANTRARISAYKADQSARHLCRYYQKLPGELLADIGMNEPEAQVKTLGRTLDSVSVRSNEFKTAWWAK